MPINISESDIITAVQSAQSGAFFRDSLPPVSEIEVQNSITWLEHKENTYRSKFREAAEAKPLEKARLVISRKSPTANFSGKNGTKGTDKQHEKNAQLESLFSSALVNMSEAKRSEWLGLREGEYLDLETGEVKTKKVTEVDRYHFEGQVTQPISEPLPSNKKPKLTRPNYKKTLTHFQTRNWNNEYRIVCTQLTSSSDAPDANTGERITQALTSRARGKIVESGVYMQAVKGGFNAFLTVTLDEKARFKLDNKHYKKDRGGKAGQIIPIAYDQNGEKLEFEMAENEEIIADGRFTFIKFDFATIGEQLSPFLDTIGKMHKRGWWARKQLFDEFVHTDLMHNNERLYPWGVVECIEKCDTRAITNQKMEICKIECEQDPNKRPVFDYMWVAEAPRKIYETRSYPWGKVDSVGHQNYHAHMLMRWNVPKHHFREWAEIIESKWSKGMVHIERIKSPAAASSYLLKALGYMSSESKGDQGEIRGNRYNISKYARAEAWENCATHESQHMYRLIQEYLQSLDEKRKRKNKAQSIVKTLVAKTAKLKTINGSDYSEKRQRFIEKLEEQLELATDKAKGLAESLHGNFARGGVAKFANAVEFQQFINNAIGVRGWRLKTVFSRECSREYIQQQRAEENAVTKMLKSAQRVVDESIESVISWYSRFERVSPNDDEYHTMSLVTGDLCAN